MNIIAVKLLSGEEVIGRLASSSILTEHIDTTGDLTLEKPMSLMVTREGITLIPYMISAGQGKITIKKEAVVAVVEDVPQPLEQGYIQETSGIAVASSVPR